MENGDGGKKSKSGVKMGNGKLEMGNGDGAKKLKTGVKMGNGKWKMVMEERS